MKIVTFNIRGVWDREADPKNGFIHRAGLIYDKVSRETPDIMAFQECTPKIMELMEKMFPEYAFCGQYRSVNYWGEGLFVAVKKADWSVISYESFWLSPTPYVAGSRYPIQSDCPRICNVVQVRHRENGKMMRIFNIHLDHISDEARIEGIKCVLAKMEEFNARLALPSVILGDFNASPQCSTIKYCDEYEKTPIADVTKDIPLTYHGWGGVLLPEYEKIDYIYVSDGLEKKLTSVGLWDDCHGGIYLSDHYPVCAEFDF